VVGGIPERVVRFPVRTVLSVLLVLLAFGLVLWIVWIARSVVTWVLIALFLALAINPLVEWLQRRGLKRRGTAVGAAYLLTLAGIAGIAALFIPTLVHQITQFVDKVPDYVHQVTKGQGPLGFLETKYHIVEKVRQALKSGGAARAVSGAGVLLHYTQSVVTAVIATLTIAFMTLFMLLEGPAWMERFYGLVPEGSQPRWRAVGHDVYRTVSGYVRGNLLISLIAGAASTFLLLALGVPFSVALGLLVALFDLIPLAGATIAAVIVTVVAYVSTGLTAAIVVGAFFVAYQQLENHVLQPLVYGRTVQLSPLAVLVSVLIGAEVAGVLGALAAIPVAGAIQVLLVDWQRQRRATRAGPPL
jgi:predicted PurR-regulated permease PerM